MICATNNEHAIIVLKSVDFVQKVTPDHRANDSIEILKDEVAGCELPGLTEDFLDRIFWARPLNETNQNRLANISIRGNGTYTAKRPHIKRRHWWVQLVEHVHGCLDTNGFAVAWGAMIDDPALPGNLEMLVRVA